MNFMISMRWVVMINKVSEVDDNEINKFLIKEKVVNGKGNHQQ